MNGHDRAHDWSPYGKRLRVDELRRTGRSVHGVRVAHGPPAAALLVHENDELVIATRRGHFIRLSARDVPVYGRRARGSRVVGLRDGDAVAAVAIAHEDAP